MTGHIRLGTAHSLLQANKMASHKRAGGDELLCGNAKKAKRQITKATFEKWQKEFEMEHQTLSWLRCDLDAKGTHVVSL